MKVTFVNWKDKRKWLAQLLLLMMSKGLSAESTEIMINAQPSTAEEVATDVAQNRRRPLPYIGYKNNTKNIEGQNSSSENKGLLKWSGSLTQAGSHNFYVALLNHQLPERSNWLKTSLGLNLDYSFGKKRFGHDAVMMHATFKHKNYWGASAVKTSNESILLGNALVGGHTHVNTKPPVWIESLWLDYSFDAIYGGGTPVVSKGLNRFKIGMFPFTLGRGISLGSTYGISQSFLAALIDENDFYMPGGLFYGTLPNEKMSYKVYLARPQARSIDDGMVLALSRGHNIDQTGLPFAGDYQDDLIIAFQLDFHLGKQDKASAKTSDSYFSSWQEKNYSGTISPYGLFYHAPAKKVKLDPDSWMSLYTVGLASEFKFGSFSFGFDTAINRGSQYVEKIDTNKLIIGNDAAGNIVTKYDKIVSTVDNKTPALATAAMIQELSQNLHRDGKAFMVDGEEFVSLASRIRDSYINSFKGSMGVIDMAYDFAAPQITLAATAGYASGGKNPHTEQTNEDYNGFFGVNESYTSTRVPSLLVLGGYGLKRPLALRSDGSGKLEDYVRSAFTDIRFIGGGISWNSQFFADYKPKFSVNTLGFWKSCPGKKILIDSETKAAQVSTFDARSFLGIEANFSCSFELMDSLTLSVNGAIFFPGCYYKDIKGATLDDKNTKQLEKMVLDQKNLKSIYSISNDNCYTLGFETKFKF